MHPDNPGAGNVFGLIRGFKVCTGTRYPSSYIGYDESKRGWLEKCTGTWERNIHAISKTTVKYTQESYAAVVCVIQSEWIFYNASQIIWGTSLR